LSFLVNSANNSKKSLTVVKFLVDKQKLKRNAANKLEEEEE
jgi:hypothetical protein